MKFNDVIALAKAGFTAEQISKLEEMEINVSVEPKPEPKPEPKTEPKKQNEITDLGGIMEELKSMRAAIVNGNIANTQMPKEQTADDILAQIINPSYGKDKKGSE